MSASGRAGVSRIGVLVSLLAVIGLGAAIAAPVLLRTLREARQLDKQTDERLRAQSAVKAVESEFEAAKSAVDTNPADASARLRLASLYGQGRKYSEALVQLLAAARLEPTKAEPHLALAQIYQSVKYYDMVLQSQREAQRLEPDNPRAIQDLAYTYVAMDWPLAALDLLAPAVKRFPTDAGLRVVLAQARYQKGAYAEALKEILEVQRLAPENHGLDGPLIEVYLMLSKPREAAAAADTFLQRDPENVIYLIGGAKALRRLGETAEAEQLLRRAVEKAPEHREARYELAIVLQERTKTDEAAQLLEPLVVENVTYKRSALVLAGLYNLQGKHREAKALRKVFDSATKLRSTSLRWSARVTNQPRDAVAHRELGKIYYQQRLYSRSVVELKEALRLDPQEISARAELGKALASMNRGDEVELAQKGTSITGRTQ